MAACIASNIDLGGRADPNFRLEYQDDLLTNAPQKTKERPNPLRIPTGKTRKNPRTGEEIEITFSPDQLIVGVYGNTTRRAIAIEAERTRKDLRDSTYTRKSYEGSFNQWREFIGGTGRYKEYFGFKGGMVVLYVFANLTSMRSAQNLLLEMTGGKGNTFILFKHMPEFGDYLRIPKPNFSFYSGPWERVEHEPYFLNQP
jgi:hypothetical protein